MMGANDVRKWAQEEATQRWGGRALVLVEAGQPDASSMTVCLLTWPFDPRLGNGRPLEEQLKSKPPTRQEMAVVSNLLPLEELQRQVAERLWPVRRPWLGLLDYDRLHWSVRSHADYSRRFSGAQEREVPEPQPAPHKHEPQPAAPPKHCKREVPA